MPAENEPADAAEELHLDRQVCFALYAASRAVTELYRPVLEQLGLTYPQYLVLLVLWQHEPRTVGELATELQLDYGTLTPLLKRLEAKQLVTRHRPAGNEATVLSALTDAGRQLRNQAVGIPHTLRTALGRPDAHANQELINTLNELTHAARTAEAPTLSTDEHTPHQEP